MTAARRLLGLGVGLLGVAASVASPASASTSLVSSDSNGSPLLGAVGQPTISADGRFVAFEFNANNPPNVIYRKDRRTGELVQVDTTSAGAPSNGSSSYARISADGRYVTFLSTATNLVAGASGTHVYRKDMQTGSVVEADMLPLGGQHFGDASDSAMSDDGQTVAFTCSCDMLNGGAATTARVLWVRNLSTGDLREFGSAATGSAANPALSPDGQWVAWKDGASSLVPGDTNGVADVFLGHVTDGSVQRGDVVSGGGESNAAADFPSVASNGVVAFESAATNLVGGVGGDTNATTDVFVHDPASGATTAVSVTPTGAIGNAGSRRATISGDGRYVGFESFASDIVAGDTNGVKDVFVRDLQLGSTRRVSVDSNGGQASLYPSNLRCCSRAISSTGRWITFWSNAQLTLDAPFGSSVYVSDASANHPPLPSLTATVSGNTVQVDASASSDPDGWVTGYSWTFGDGGTANGPAGPHTYAGGGTYTVSVTVTDNEGLTATASRNVVISMPTTTTTTSSTTTTTTTVTTTTTTSQTTTTRPPAPSAARLTHVARSRKGLKLTLTCPASALAGCRGSFALKLVPKHGRAKALSGVRYSIGRGRKITVQVKLSSGLRKLDAIKGVRLQVAAPGRNPSFLTISKR